MSIDVNGGKLAARRAGPENSSRNAAFDFYSGKEIRHLEAIVNEAWRQMRVLRHPLARREHEVEVREALAREIFKLRAEGIRDLPQLKEGALAALNASKVD